MGINESWLEIAELIRDDDLQLDQKDISFLKRVYGGSPLRYQKRLENIGYLCGSNILDAGCGFGQWSFALQIMGYKVTGIDNSSDRIGVCNSLKSGLTGIHKLHFELSELHKTKYPAACFDGIFCYSAIYYCDWKRVLHEFHRLLAVDGRIYLNANGIGWYLKNIIDNPNVTEDFSPREMSYRAISNTINSLYSNQSFIGDEIIPSDVMKEFMSDIGFEILYVGPEGTFNNSGPDHEEDLAFFPGRYDNFECVYEIVATKI